MIRCTRHLIATALTVLSIVARPSATALLGRAETDLDAFMRQVLARRDDNWKKLQQYILDERERIELRGPTRQLVWGEEREYTWYIREGFFVRSPVKFNGVTVGDDDRRKYEAEFLRREQRRERYWLRGRPAEEQPAAEAAGSAPADVQGILRQTREPAFITSAYFLRFKFEEGRYALVGRERLEDRDVLRVEYYPARLFLHQQRRAEAAPSDPQKAQAAELERMMNKVSLVTLWVDPSLHQIMKYTFENIDADFLPASWLVRVGDIRASMTMGQPFQEVWLPKRLDVSAGFTLALGAFDVQYSLDYHDYKQADVKSKVAIPEVR